MHEETVFIHRKKMVMLERRQKFPNEENESCLQHRYAAVVRDLSLIGCKATRRKKLRKIRCTFCKKILPPSQKTGTVHTENYLEFIRAWEDLCWNHDTSTPHRSETKRGADNAARRAKEGTSLCSSGAVGSFRKVVWEKRWSASVICETRKTKVADRTSTHESRFGTPFDGPGTPFGTEIHVDPLSTKYKSRHHQLGTKIIPGIFIGYALNSGGGWTGDSIIADWHNIDNNVTSEVHVKRFKSKEAGTNILQEILLFPRRWFPERRRSRTTSNHTPPGSRELRRGEEYPPRWARPG